MNKKYLDILIKQGETYNIEFKESLSDNINRDICAFANASGGKLLIGVSDNGAIKGTDKSNKIRSQLQDLARNFDPKLSINIFEVASIIIVDVPEGRNKPYSTNGKFYIRQGPNSQQLSRDDIRDFFQKEGMIHFDEKLNNRFSLAKDLDKNSFRIFLNKAKISRLLKQKDVLENLSLLENNKMKNAGVLLFSRKMTKFFAHATIICALYEGTTKYKILDRKEFESDIYSNFHETLNYLYSKLNTEFIIKGGPREEKLEFPEDALREALINSMVHRSYFIRSSILVEIFSDRIEITNPGGLVKGLDKKDFGRKSLSRNNLLFSLAQRMGLVEKMGSGILRIKKAMKDYGLELGIIERIGSDRDGYWKIIQTSKANQKI